MFIFYLKSLFSVNNSMKVDEILAVSKLLALEKNFFFAISYHNIHITLPV